MMPVPTKLVRALSNPFKKGANKQQTMILAAVQQSVEEVSSHSRVLPSPAWESVDFYDRDDIRVGKLLEGGAFFDFYKVKRLPDQDASENSSRGSRASNFGYLDDDDELEGSSQKNNNNNKNREHFVMKQMTPKVFSENAQVLQQAALGLVLEAKYLSRLTHRNIIRAKGLPFGEETCLSQGTPGSFFLVTPRMVETLSDRMDRWRRYPAGDVRRTEVEAFEGRMFRSKLSLARDIASALDYLHKRKLVLINLNPSHIGFLEDGTLQITDLSCAQELDFDEDNSETPECDPSCDPAGETQKSKKRSGKGTSTSALVQIAADGKVPRYVAPEVVLQQDDNDINARRQWCAPPADSYSFALIVFELLTLGQAYNGYKTGQHRMKVCTDGQRPNLSVYKLPKILEELLARSWRKTASKRLNMAQILQALPEPKQEAVLVAPRQA